MAEYAMCILNMFLSYEKCFMANYNENYSSRDFQNVVGHFVFSKIEVENRKVVQIRNFKEPLFVIHEH